MFLKKLSSTLKHPLQISSRSYKYEYIAPTTYACKSYKSEFSTTVRGNFNKLTSKDIDFFQSLLGPNRIVQHSDDLVSYNTDWLKSHKGASALALRPKTTEEVSEILKYCNKQKLAVCPQGGNTGLVGGSIPIFDEIVVSMSLMNDVLHFDDNT
ncbi:D-2-hydroxyglutarate dehydrogenase, mitochondrial, partial [Araneus ventricosus]